MRIRNVIIALLLVSTVGLSGCLAHHHHSGNYRVVHKIYYSEIYPYGETKRSCAIQPCANYYN